MKKLIFLIFMLFIFSFCSKNEDDEVFDPTVSFVRYVTPKNLKELKLSGNKSVTFDIAYNISTNEIGANDYYLTQVRLDDKNSMSGFVVNKKKLSTRTDTISFKLLFSLNPGDTLWYETYISKKETETISTRIIKADDFAAIGIK